MKAHEQWAAKTAWFRRDDNYGSPAERELVELADAAIAEKDEKLDRLRCEGVPGVMHEVDKAFYDLAITERNFARFQVANREAEIAQLRRRLAELGEVVT